MRSEINAIFAHDQELVEKAYEFVSRPEGVLGHTFEEWEDLDGEPAAKIQILVEYHVNPPAEWITRLAEYTNRLHAYLIDHGMKTWPYVSVHEFRDRAGRNRVSAR